MRCYKPKRYDLPLFLNGGGGQLLEPVVDLWYINYSHIWGNRAKIDHLKKLDKNKEIFVYGSGQNITSSTTSHRGLFWYLYDFGIRGYCCWNQGCRAPTDRLLKPGNNHVWYSGKNLGYLGPLPSLRMKSWRRGSLDAEYLFLAEKNSSREKIETILQDLCRYEKTNSKYKFTKLPVLNQNPLIFEIARIKLAEMILGNIAEVKGIDENQNTRNLQFYLEKMRTKRDRQSK